MGKPRILIQIDPDPQASVFDAVVAIDAGVDHLLRYHSVSTDQVRDLVHGAMFTRGPEDLRNTAIFIGGSDVASAEQLLEQVRQCYFGPLCVSVMLDANGANTTAAAAVLEASRHVPLRGSSALVLAATGSVGRRTVRLLAREGTVVHVASRSHQRATEVCQSVLDKVPKACVTPIATSVPQSLSQALHAAQIIISAGAAGVEILPEEAWQVCSNLNVAIDLNAVPPAGIGGIAARDSAVQRGAVSCYGALGIGGLKMKIHKAAIRKLFEANDQVLDAEEILAVGRDLAV